MGLKFRQKRGFVVYSCLRLFQPPFNPLEGVQPINREINKRINIKKRKRITQKVKRNARAGVFSIEAKKHFSDVWRWWFPLPLSRFSLWLCVAFFCVTPYPIHPHTKKTAASPLYEQIKGGSLFRFFRCSSRCEQQKIQVG